jgi:prevent-host-death family protein
LLALTARRSLPGWQCAGAGQRGKAIHSPCSLRLPERVLQAGYTDRYGHYAEITMITETTAVTFRQNLGDMLNRVQYRHDSIVVNKDGKPVAALVDARLFARIRRMQARFDALSERIEAGFAPVPEADGLAEIDATVAQVRAQNKTR